MNPSSTPCPGDAAQHRAPPLTLYGQPLSSRLLLGSSAYPNATLMQQALSAAAPAMVTVALRRQMAAGQGGAQFWSLLRALNPPLLPNTAGCQSADEAVTMARMAREVFDTRWIKLEVIGDDYTLQPDMAQLTDACRTLVAEGFYVLPYCTEDLVACRRLLDAGCEALMPWAAPIGSGRGPTNPDGLRLLRERLPDVPLIVDAGLGLPSHACQVMEWGYDGVLLNSAVARALEPVAMARAFAQAVVAGRAAFEAGPMAQAERAQASTPVVGMPFWQGGTA